MNRKILVTYASYGGTTAEIASAIGKALAANGAEVDVLPVTEVFNPGAYQAVIIGSGVHSGKWMPEALAFVNQYQDVLRQLPTAVFQVCMMLAGSNEQYRNLVPEWIAPLRNQIHPIAEGSFAGALLPARYPKLTEKLGLNIFLAAIKLKAGDYRDWNAIYAWAEQVSRLFMPQVIHG